MANIVKILSDDRGERYTNNYWHLLINRGGGTMAYCTGEFVGIGESACVFKTKQGKITCPECITLIKEIKAIKL